MELMIAFREMVLPFPGTPCIIMPRFHGTESFLYRSAFLKKPAIVSHRYSRSWLVIGRDGRAYLGCHQ
jgi:hypothetical protein